jgi:hypothetical protein
MQRRNLGKAMRYLVAVCALVSSLAMFACGGDDGGGGGQTFNIGATVPVRANTVAALQGQALTISNGTVFNAAIGNNPVTLTFNTSTTFTLVRGTSTATGTVAYGSCTFTVTASTFAAGTGPQVGNTVTFPTCTITVSASNVEQGGSQVSGTLTLVLSGATGSASSSPVTVNVFASATGELFVVNLTTGATVDTNTNITNTGIVTTGG